MSNIFAKIVAFFSAIIVTITGWFSFADKKDPKPDDSKPTTTVTQKVTTKKTTAKTKKPTTTQAEATINDAVFLSEAAITLNVARKAAGLAELKVDDNLVKAATIRAKELATSFSHTRPDGRAFSTVFEDLKLAKPLPIAENITSAKKYSGAADIIGVWVGSNEHRNNILSSKYSKFGIAWYKAQGGKQYAVLLLAN